MMKLENILVAIGKPVCCACDGFTALNRWCEEQGSLGAGRAGMFLMAKAMKVIARTKRWLWVNYKLANRKCVKLTSSEIGQHIVIYVMMICILVPGLEISLQYLDALGEINYPTGAARHE